MPDVQSRGFLGRRTGRCGSARAPRARGPTNWPGMSVNGSQMSADTHQAVVPRRFQPRANR